MATATQNGPLLSYPPAPPADWSLAERERAVLGVLADVAAIQFEALPETSLVRRLLEAPIHELDCWATDPRYEGRSLGFGGAAPRNRPRSKSFPRPDRRTAEDQYAEILRLREQGYTQREVAAIVGCAQSVVSRVERNRTAPRSSGPARR